MYLCLLGQVTQSETIALYSLGRAYNDTYNTKLFFFLMTLLRNTITVLSAPEQPETLSQERLMNA